MVLLGSGADVHLKDSRGRSPLDFASISPKVWYLFEERGHQKTAKQQLIELEVVKEVCLSVFFFEISKLYYNQKVEDT